MKKDCSSLQAGVFFLFFFLLKTIRGRPNRGRRADCLTSAKGPTLRQQVSDLYFPSTQDERREAPLLPPVISHLKKKKDLHVLADAF